jgi:hypothetical protein
LNAERLHAIALAVRDDLAATEEVSLVQQLAASLRQQVQAPAEPTYGVQTSELRQQLNARLAGAPSNTFSAAWHQTLEELGIADLLGEKLRQRIEEIFLRNEITQAAAADELEVIAQEVQNLDANLNQLIAAYASFGIGAEELAPGEFEIGFLIPRDAVDDELGQLGREFVELKKEILGPIQELATGTRSDLTVSVISSSDFQVFLEAVPDVCGHALADRGGPLRRLREDQADPRKDLGAARRWRARGGC